MWGRHSDEPEETCAELSAMLSAALSEFRYAAEKVRYNIDHLEAIAQDLQARGDEVYDPNDRLTADFNRVAADALIALDIAVNSMNAIRVSLGKR